MKPKAMLKRLLSMFQSKKTVELIRVLEHVGGGVRGC
jgi:hypothetical protein